MFFELELESNLEEKTKDDYFKLVETFIERHDRERYSLRFNYNITKQTIKVLGEVERRLKDKYGEKIVGISVYGSRARGYAFSVEDDFDMILIHDGLKTDERVRIIGELRDIVRKLEGFPCKVGTDHFDISSIEKTPSQREKNGRSLDHMADEDVYYLFYGCPIAGTKRIIESRAKYLKKAILAEEERKYWERIVDKLHERLDLPLKSAVRLLRKVVSKEQLSLTRYFITDEEDVSCYYEFPFEMKDVVDMAINRMNKGIQKKSEFVGFNKDPAEELKRIEDWISRHST